MSVVAVKGADLRGTGFLDVKGARSALRRMKLRAKLREAQDSIPALLDLLDHGSDVDGDVGPRPVERGVGLNIGNVEGSVGSVTIDGVEGQNVREQELLEGSDLILQFLDALRVGLAHGAFSIPDAEQRKHRAELRHRLSGDAK